MIQQFIELGQGYGDVYELCELIKTNEARFHGAFIFTSYKDEQKVCSLAVALKPVGESKFMPLYICREGIPYNEDKRAKRIDLFEEALAAIEKQAITLEIKHSSFFKEPNQFYQYLIGILRMSRYIPPMH
ncbi:MAG: methylthioribose kinase [Lysinibacillus sp.]